MLGMMNIGDAGWGAAELVDHSLNVQQFKVQEHEWIILVEDHLAKPA